ncbi:hypothetical protein F6X86_11705 [Enterococcus durans]|uniref:hypothetical protein n=2 Tax=Enterococcus durans TaxID=53345 RepID=UPI00124470B0|nr:hypothetical protein [Enterococcus durans]KAA9177349.1 hypothetical protein F6X86_11705 [Enterococcus durans]
MNKLTIHFANEVKEFEQDDRSLKPIVPNRYLTILLEGFKKAMSEVTYVDLTQEETMKSIEKRREDRHSTSSVNDENVPFKTVNQTSTVRYYYFCDLQFTKIENLREYFFKHYTTFLSPEDRNLPYWKEFHQAVDTYKNFDLSNLKLKNRIELSELFKKYELLVTLKMTEKIQDASIKFSQVKQIDDKNIILGKDNSPLAVGLRYIYHSPELKQKFSFFMGTNLIDSPWVTNPSLWETCQRDKEARVAIDEASNRIQTAKENKLAGVKLLDKRNRIVVYKSGNDPKNTQMEGYNNLYMMEGEDIQSSNKYSQAIMKAYDNYLNKVSFSNADKFISLNNEYVYNHKLKFNSEFELKKYFFERYPLFLTEKESKYPFWQAFNQAISQYKEFEIDNISKYGKYSLPGFLKKSELQITMDMVKSQSELNLCFDFSTKINFKDIVLGKDNSPIACALRYVFHDQELNKKVKCYEKGKEIATPWEQSPSLWENTVKDIHTDLTVSLDTHKSLTKVWKLTEKTEQVPSEDFKAAKTNSLEISAIKVKLSELRNQNDLKDPEKKDSKKKIELNINER